MTTPAPITQPSSPPDPELLQFAHKADAYLEWAVATLWGGFHRDDDRVTILVQRNPDVKDEQWNQWLSSHNNEVEMTACYFGHQHVVLVVTAAFLESPNQRASCNEVILRMELAAALTPPRNPHVFQDDKENAHRVQWQPTAETIIACIDDAFPIASKRFFQGNEESRVLRLWDQGQNQTVWYALRDVQTGMQKANFYYGGEVLNQKYLKRTGPLSTQAGGPAIKKITVPSLSDSQEDVAYYERWGMKQLRPHHTHGSHVLDTLAGPIPVLNRVPISRRSKLGSDAAASVPPTWQEKPVGEKTEADLVLVQLPQSAINDPSGRWLGHHVLDGLHYILQASGEAKKIVTNISWGPQTGPHDGSSLLELAMDELLDKHKKLSITLPAGNSFQARAHAEWTLNSNPTTRELTWCIPPAIKHLSFLEIWSDRNDAFEVTLTSPTGKITTLNSLGIQKGSGCGLVQLSHNQTRAMALVVVQPTESEDAIVRAPHGIWKVQVSQRKEQETKFHAYITRSSSNMGGSYQQPNSYLLDQAYEDLRRQPPHRQTLPVKVDCVTQEGTLNGIGTGQAQSLYVLSGYRLTEGTPTPYSSSGPVVGGRTRPDFAFPSDESAALMGLAAGATRAGTVVRLTGTSAASPQMGRWLLNNVNMPPARGVQHNNRHGYGKKT